MSSLFTTFLIQSSDQVIICVGIPENPAICEAIIFVEKPPTPSPVADSGINSANSSESYSI